MQVIGVRVPAKVPGGQLGRPAGLARATLQSGSFGPTCATMCLLRRIWCSRSKRLLVAYSIGQQGEGAHSDPGITRHLTWDGQALRNRHRSRCSGQRDDDGGGRRSAQSKVRSALTGAALSATRMRAPFPCVTRAVARCPSTYIPTASPCDRGPRWGRTYTGTRPRSRPTIAGNVCLTRVQGRLHAVR